MSWKTNGTLLSGPPTTSNTNRLDPRFRPNLSGQSAFQREQQLVRQYGGREDGEKEIRRSDWDVLQENHRFIRDDEDTSNVSWEERLARAYESKLFKEFALIDLKHYKSRRLALRWRTAEEVVDGIGEDTCAGLRCKYHQPFPPSPRNNRSMWEDDSVGASSSRQQNISHRHSRKMPVLRPMELPFVYEERGERKEALVKVKLCPRCQSKLTWKPGRRSGAREDDDSQQSGDDRQRPTDIQLEREDRGLGESKGRRNAAHHERSSRVDGSRPESPTARYRIGRPRSRSRSRDRRRSRSPKNRDRNRKDP